MQNTIYTADNLFILNGLNSKSVDMVYLDPPFNSKRVYSASVGSKSAGASFKDMWSWDDVNEAYLEHLIDTHSPLIKYIEAVGNIHSTAMLAYLVYMSQRVIQMHRVLKSTGSLYLHVDPTASHYLKVILDEIFGKSNFRNEIIWRYETGGVPRKDYSRKHDTILRYTKSATYDFYPNEIKEKRSEEVLRRIATGNENATRATTRTKHPSDVLMIPAINAMAKERTGYPTQKPLALLHNLVLGATKEGDVVLDPFCGCATTCVKAQHLGRKWIGIDIEKQAADLLIERLSDESDSLFEDFIHTTQRPQRTDIRFIKITRAVKEQLYKEKGGLCGGCTKKFKIFDLKIDHIIPKSEGGEDYYENYQLLCSKCNRLKGDRPMEYLRIKIQAREKILQQKISFGL